VVLGVVYIMRGAVLSMTSRRGLAGKPMCRGMRNRVS